MGQTHDEIAQPLAERLCRQGAQRDATRIVRRRSRKPLVDGVYQLATGVLLDACFPFLQDLVRYGLKTLFGIDSMRCTPLARQFETEIKITC